MASRSSRSRSNTSLAAALALVEVVTLVGPVVRKLHVDAEVFAFERRYYLLQRVAILAAHADGVALDCSLDFELCILDQLHNLASLLNWDTLLQFDLLAHG